MNNRESSIQSDGSSLFESQSLSFNNHRPKKNRYKLSKINNPNASKCSSGRWSKEQQTLYAKFLEDNQKWFRDISIRRNEKVFKLLSQFIITRSSTQCRSHHQKMIKKCGSLENIILFVRNPDLFEERFVNRNDASVWSLNQEYSLVQKKQKQNSIIPNSSITEAFTKQRDGEVSIQPAIENNFESGYLSPRLFIEPQKVEIWKLDDLQL